MAKAKKSRKAPARKGKSGATADHGSWVSSWVQFLPLVGVLVLSLVANYFASHLTSSKDNARLPSSIGQGAIIADPVGGVYHLPEQ
ncbi:MAG: hypothetical protein ACXVBW_11130 [Bdellovibrionota bacterium]